MTSPIPRASHLDLNRFTSSWAKLQQTKLYDLVAALPLIGWFGLTGYQQVVQIVDGLEKAQSGAVDAALVIAMLSKVVALAFVVVLLVLVFLRRPAQAKAKGLVPRLSAFLGTYLGLAVVFLPPQPPGVGLHLLSLVLMLSGLGFSVYALLHLGRSFSLMAEARRLVIDGPYAKIRHPLYLGEGIATLGIALQYISAFALLLFAIQFAFQLIRMKNEELVLAEHFPEYSDYRMRTARLVPGLY